jgi:hypothetical protein
MRVRLHPRATSVRPHRPAVAGEPADHRAKRTTRPIYRYCHDHRHGLAPRPGAERMAAQMGMSMNETDSTGEVEIEPPPIAKVQQLLDQIEDALEKAVTASPQAEPQ